MSESGLQAYVIRGGSEGRARLGVLARVLAPTTAQHLNRAGPLDGATVIDVASGGGDVAFEIARRVGPGGRVFGIDLDEEKLALARDEAGDRGLTNVTFHQADVLQPWPFGGAHMVYARFILTHVTDPPHLLRRAIDALVPGGKILAEDVNIAGQFCDPPSRAVERSYELYVEAAQKRGGDPFIGRRLARLLDDAGFADVDTALVQPFGRTGDAKSMASLTFAAIADGLVADGLATRDEMRAIAAEIAAFTARPDTTISMPRIFQAWGTRR